MNDTTHYDDERFLATFIEPARRAAENPELSAAADRLRDRLPEPASFRSTGWLPRFAALSVLITGLAISMPMILPGGGGTAFAQVQAWFSGYSTVDVRTTILRESDEIVDVRARATAAGNARIEQMGVTHILSASAGTFITLLPGQRYMQQTIDGMSGSVDGMEWIDKLGAFQGEAVVLDDTQVISGRQAIGHRLVIDGTDLTLWSALSDNRPLLLEGELPGGLQLRTTFEFNVELPPWLFELPPGFSPIEGD